MKPSGVLNFENVPADAGDPDVKVYVNGAEVSAGGVGDSDFSTAEVTITISDENVNAIIIPIATDNDDYGETADTGIAASGTYSVILYKGKALGAIDATVPPIMLNISLTGDIAYEDDLVITGNGTITIASNEA